MTYKYYSVMRPAAIGTFPGKPVKIVNYQEGKKYVIAADDRALMAWGELEYNEPLTENEIYKFELKPDYEYTPCKHRGWWMGDDQKGEIISLGKKYYVLNGWDGESYKECFECLTKTKMADPDTVYTLIPVYRYETQAGIALMDEMADMDEDSAEWAENRDYLNEIISYTVVKH